MHNLSLSTAKLETFSETGQRLEIATGFWFIGERTDCFYLITNWHVVTGRKPTDPMVSKTGAVPVKLTALAHQAIGGGRVNPNLIGAFSFELNDPDGEAPRWLEHPTLRHRADVVAIKIEMAPQASSFAELAFIGDQALFEPAEPFEPQVLDDVFVLGYPWGLTGGNLAMPIYKRGTIASEPELNQNSLPRYLIDCRTASGMSGSPVIVVRSVFGAPHGAAGEPLFGRIGSFAGVYSGRLEASEMPQDQGLLQTIGERDAMTEIGIVWRRSVLEEIVQAEVRGSTLSDISRLKHQRD